MYLTTHRTPHTAARRAWAGILVALLALAVPAAADETTVFKTTDENGNVVFTDKPPENAQPVEIKEPMTFPAGKLAEDYDQFSPAETEAPMHQPLPYTVLHVSAPADDETIRSNPGNVEVDFEIKPALKRGHTIQILLDDEVIRETRSVGTVALENVDRGTHELQLEVVAAGSDTVLQRSNVVSFTLLRYHKPAK